jgi:hypothetical protein
MYTAGGVALFAGLVVLGPVTGVIAGSSVGLINVFTTGKSLHQQQRVRARLRLPDIETMAELRLAQLKRVAVVGVNRGWGLELPYEAPTRLQELVERQWWVPVREKRPERTTLVTGEDAVRAAAKILPALNETGAAKSEVRTAVEIMEEVNEPRSLFKRYAGRDGDEGHTLSNLPKEVLLALEMVTHEESERRALEGELAVLEAAWKEAEEIAAIADDLLVPDEAKRRITALKRGDDTR